LLLELLPSCNLLTRSSGTTKAAMQPAQMAMLCGVPCLALLTFLGVQVEGERVVRRADSTDSGQLGQQNCIDISGQYSTNYGKNCSLFQNGCLGEKIGYNDDWFYKVEGTILTVIGGRWEGMTASISGSSSLTLKWEEGSIYSQTGELDTGGAMTGPDFASWMNQCCSAGVPQGGYACGYSNGWCGCSCGHNQGNTTPCYLPPMQPGTEGGHTCGYYGELYGCAEAHNTLEGCPQTSTAPSPPLSGKGA